MQNPIKDRLLIIVFSVTAASRLVAHVPWLMQNVTALIPFKASNALEVLSHILKIMLHN
jgi:hypothetical protein